MENNSRKKLYKSIVCIAVILLYILGLQNILRISSLLDITSMIRNSADIHKRETIKEYILRNFYKDVDPSVLDEGSYKGILSSLDDKYSEYFTAEEYEAFNINTSSTYAGIGAQLFKDPDTQEAVVSRIFDGTPAQESGLQVGDTIVSANGHYSFSMDLNSFVHILRGEEGSSVEVVYRRNGSEHTVEIVRRHIILPSVYSEMVDEDTGYIQIGSFASNTANEFRQAIEDLTAQGMTNVIYDVRSNPGGYVDTAVDILDDILPEGITVYVEDKYKKRTDYYSDEEHQINIPSVTLIDENTASASEIFGGALQDYKWSTLVGTVTTGKGVVQNISSLSDGSAIKLTFAQYFTPLGRSINEIGLTPDIELEYQYDYSGQEAEEYDFYRDNQVVKALEILDNAQAPGGPSH